VLLVEFYLKEKKEEIGLGLKALKFQVLTMLRHEDLLWLRLDMLKV
jgi:hypothetical protein